MTVRVDIERLRSLHEKATPGEWRGGHRCDGSIRATVDGKRVSICADLSTADAAYIAALHNALPTLAAALERAQRVEAAARFVVSNLHGTLFNELGATSYAFGEHAMRVAERELSELRAAFAQPDEKEGKDG